jgi:hypothetical protein
MLRKMKKNELSPHIELYPIKVFPTFFHLNKFSRIHIEHIYNRLDRANSHSDMFQNTHKLETDLTANGSDENPKIKRNNSDSFSKIYPMRKQLVNAI